MSGLDNPDVIVGGWRVDQQGESFRLFRRQTVRAEVWHERHRDVGPQYGRSIAVPKATQAEIMAAMQKDGLVVRERRHHRDRTVFVGDPASCRPPV